MAGSVKTSKRTIERRRRDGQIVQATIANVTYIGASGTSSGTGDTTGDLSAQELLDLISQVDGSGSGLDADMVDGKHATDFALAGHNHDNRYYTETETDAALALKAPLLNPVFTGTVTADNLTIIDEAEIDELVSSDYSSGGFSGSGHRLGIDNGESILEVDKLVVRGSMDAYELIIHKLRATNGALIVAPGAKALSGISQDTNGYYIEVKAEEQVFAPGDIIKAQKFMGNGTYSRTYKVSSISGGKVYVTTVAGGNPTVVDVSGEEYVRIGNATDTSRQGSIYISSDDTGAPFMKVLDGVDSGTFDTDDAKVIVGKLTGSGKTFSGTPITGYGMYAENAYITGKISGQLLYLEGSTPRDVAVQLPGAALVGNPNLITYGWRDQSGTGYPIIQRNHILYLTAGVTYTFSARGKVVSSGARLDVMIFENTWTSFVSIEISETSYITKYARFTPSITGYYTVAFYSYPQGGGGTVSLLWYMLQEGEVYIDQNTVFKYTAEEDITNKENLLVNSAEINEPSTTSDYHSYLIASTSINPDSRYQLLRGYLYTFSIEESSLSSGTKFNVSIWNGTTRTLLQMWEFTTGQKNTCTFRVPGGTDDISLLLYTGLRGSTANVSATWNRLMLQCGHLSTPWRVAVAETAAGIAAGVEAKAKTDGFTTIEGGLITTNIIKLGNLDGQEKAGISGTEKDASDNSLPAFWAGGTYEQAIAGTTKVIIKHDGSSKLSGITEIGTEPEIYDGRLGGIAIKGSDIWENAYTGAQQGVLYINRLGYQGGYSQYRDTSIGNGKGEEVLRIQGNGRIVHAFILNVIGESAFNGEAYFGNNVTIEGMVDIHQFNVSSYTDGFINITHNQPTSGKYVAANFVTKGNSRSAQGISIQCGKDIPTSETDTFIGFLSGNGSIVGAVVNNTTAGLTLYSVSDKRLKTNIKDARINGLEVLSAIPIREFNWRKKDKDNKPTKESYDENIVGYVAQEVESVLPAMVTHDEDHDIYSVSKEALIPYLHKAILELKQEIKTLKR